MKKNKGLTLIDVIVGTALMLIVFLGISGAYYFGFKVVGLNERKIAATQIGQGEIEKKNSKNRKIEDKYKKIEIEKIRNLPYLEVGIIDGQLPNASGTLEASTSTILNGVEYRIERKIEYVLDSLDDGADSQLNPPCYLDYKKVEIKISWSDRFSGETKLVTDVFPRNKVEEIQSCQEQPSGVLRIQVFDTLGVFVSNPLIEVYDPATGSLKASYTPDDGIHDIPLSSGSYKVVISKTGYSKEETFALGDVYQGRTIATPQNPNPIIFEGQTTQLSFQIDRVSSFLVKTLNLPTEGDPLPVLNVQFDLRGEKIVGKDVNEEPIYKFSTTTQTNSSGQVQIQNLEWDIYHFFNFQKNLQGLDLTTSTPSHPISLEPATTTDVNLYLEAQNSLLVTVLDIDSSEPIFSASTTLSRTGYQESQYTNTRGQTLFIPLEAENYDLSVEALGYFSTSTTVSVSGKSTKTINLKVLD